MVKFLSKKKKKEKKSFGHKTSLLFLRSVPKPEDLAKNIYMCVCMNIYVYEDKSIHKDMNSLMYEGMDITYLLPSITEALRNLMFFNILWNEKSSLMGENYFTGTKIKNKFKTVTDMYKTSMR